MDINEIIAYGFGFASIILFMVFMWIDTDIKKH